MTADEQLVEMFETIKSMHQLVIDMQAAFSATQIGLIAVIEQLTRAGLIDGKLAADRMRELKDTRFVSKEAMRAIDVLAQEIEVIGGPYEPKPPRGGKPTLVVLL